MEIWTLSAQDHIDGLHIMFFYQISVHSFEFYDLEYEELLRHKTGWMIQKKVGCLITVYLCYCIFYIRLNKGWFLYSSWHWSLFLTDPRQWQTQHKAHHIIDFKHHISQDKTNTEMLGRDCTYFSWQKTKTYR